MLLIKTIATSKGLCQVKETQMGQIKYNNLANFTLVGLGCRNYIKAWGAADLPSHYFFFFNIVEFFFFKVCHSV